MVTFWTAVWLATAIALLVMLINEATEAEDRTGAFRRTWARVRRVRLRSPVTLAAA